MFSISQSQSFFTKTSNKQIIGMISSGHSPLVILDELCKRLLSYLWMTVEDNNSSINSPKTVMDVYRADVNFL